MDNIFLPVEKRENLSKKIAFEIETAIQERRILVGAKLPAELNLAQQFNVSRATIREALRILHAKGILSILKGKGIFVEGISSEHVSIPMQAYLKFQMGEKTILDLIETRLIIEPSIAENAAINRSPEDLALMKDNIASLRELGDDPIEFANLDMQFHQHIANATQNALMGLIIKPIFDLLPLLKVRVIKNVPGAVQAAIHWHRRIFYAIESGNPELAATTMKEHLQIAKEHAQMLNEKNKT
jgi:GntR family transcriptional repressor for pyruvate dehydrogenase complex